MNNINGLYFRTMNITRIFVMLAGLFWSGVLALLADTHYVSLDGTNDAAGGYTNWVGAATQIQWAVNAATAGDTVLVSNGTYNLTNRISIAANITVRSLNGTNFTFVDGGYPARTNQCFYMTAGTLDGFTIRNGSTTNTTAWQGGGGVQLNGANINVLNCYIYGNRVTNATSDSSQSGGGGIFLSSICGGSIISNCTIVSNAVGGTSSGGGIFVYSAALFVACRVSGNWAPNAGGMYLINGSVSNCTVDNNAANSIGGIESGSSGTLITDCVISNNLSNAYRAGGISLAGSSKVRNSIITGNKATYGGGVYLQPVSGIPLLSNCLVTANTATQSFGGGIYLIGYNSPGVVANCTIAGNVAKDGGAGLYVITGGTYSQLVQNCLIYGNTNLGASGGGVHLNWTGQYPYGLINCTIAGNEGGTAGGGIYTTTTNNYIANCIIYGNVTTNDTNDEVYNVAADGANNYWYNCAPTNLVAGQGNITNNPLFIDAGNRNYRLSANSPCVNTGTNMSWMTGAFDLDGRMRIRYGTVDMGTYETIYRGTMFSFR